MPKVPQLQANRVQQVALPGVRVRNSATAETFGGGASADRAMNSFQKAADIGAQVFERERQEADKIRVSEEVDKALRQKMTYQSEARKRLGKDAFGLLDEVSPEFQKYLKSAEEGLSNTQQKEMFRAMSRDISRDLDGSLMSHMDQETMRYESEVNKALVVTLQEDAIENYKDPGKVQDSLKKVEAQIRSQRGISDEAAALEVQDAYSKTHAGVIDRMLSNGEDLQASQYYKDHKEQISGTYQAKLEGALEEGTLRGQSQRISQDIASKYTDLASALKAVDKYDGKLEDEIRQRVKERFSERESAQNLSSKQAYHEAYRIAETEGSKDKIPPGLWNSLSPEHKNSINSFLNKPDAPPDMELYYDLKTMAANPETRDAFRNMDLLPHKKALGSNFEKLVDFQTSLEKGEDSKLDGVLTDMQIIGDILQQNDISGKDKQALFRQKIDEQAQGFYEQHKRKPNNNELREMGVALMAETITHDGWLWDTKKRTYEIDDDDVPSNDRKQIEASLRKKGLPVTADRIMQMYKRMKEVRGN